METSHIGKNPARGDVRTSTFVGTLVVVALLIASATAFILWRSRIDAFRRSDAAIETVLRAVAQDLQRTMAFYDTSLRWAIAGLSTPGFDQASGPVRRQMLFASDLEAHALGGILIADASGRSLYESGAEVPRIASIADKSYFIALRDHPELGLALSRPFQTVIASGPSIALARRINRTDGRFGGVAVSTIGLMHLHELIASAAAGTNDTITLMNDDGIILARAPWIEQAIGNDVSSRPEWQQVWIRRGGSMDATVAADGLLRHYRFVHVGELPLVLMGGSTFASIYADWWRQTIAIGGITAVTIALLLGLARALHAELVRRRHAELIALQAADQFRMLAENASDMIVRLDLSGVRRYVSPAARDVLGYTPEEMMDRALRDIVVPEDLPIIEDALNALRAGTEYVTVAYRCYKKLGTQIWVEARIRLVRNVETGQPWELIALTRDVTSSHRSEQALRHLATTDGLTGLANRRTFDEILDTEWRRSIRSVEPIALVMLDVDYFKLYNDRYGHPDGDSVLRTVASCLANSAHRATDLAARYGGEEFVLLLPDTTLSGAVSVADQVRKDIELRKLPHEASPLNYVTVSVGVAGCMAMDGNDPAALLRDADAALYDAKRNGRNRVVVWATTSAVAAG